MWSQEFGKIAPINYKLSICYFSVDEGRFPSINILTQNSASVRLNAFTEIVFHQWWVLVEIKPLPWYDNLVHLNIELLCSAKLKIKMTRCLKWLLNAVIILCVNVVFSQNDAKFSNLKVTSFFKPLKLSKCIIRNCYVLGSPLSNTT